MKSPCVKSSASIKAAPSVGPKAATAQEDDHESMGMDSSLVVVCENGASRDELLSRIHAGVRSGFAIGHLTVQLESPDWEQAETHL